MSFLLGFLHPGPQTRDNRYFTIIIIISNTKEAVLQCTFSENSSVSEEMADRTESVIARTIQHVKVHLRLTNPEKASSVMGEPQGNLGNHRQSFKWHKKS